MVCWGTFLKSCPPALFLSRSIYRGSNNRLTSAIPSDFKGNCASNYLVFGEIVSFALNTFSRRLIQLSKSHQELLEVSSQIQCWSSEISLLQSQIQGLTFSLSDILIGKGPMKRGQLNKEDVESGARTYGTVPFVQLLICIFASCSCAEKICFCLYVAETISRSGIGVKISFTK